MGLGLNEAGEATEDGKRAGSEDTGYSWSLGSVLRAKESNLQQKCKYMLSVCTL